MAHLKAAQTLHDEIEEATDTGICLWLDRVQIAYGLEKISEIIGVEIVEEKPYGTIDDWVENVVNVNGVKFSFTKEQV